jgi:hypothetical protein
MPLCGDDQRHSHGSYLALKEHQHSALGVLEQVTRLLAARDGDEYGIVVGLLIVASKGT